MKAVVLLSKTFFPQHPKAGQPTDFASKVMTSVYQNPIYGNHYKIHTCRINYVYWKNKIDKLKAEGGVLSIRQWSTIPYRSPQEIIVDIPADIVGIQKLTLSRDTNRYYSIVYNEDKEGWHSVPVQKLANNDGLSVEDFKDWFSPVFDKKDTNVLELAIIYFTKYRYLCKV
jgi:hypothetical protein